MSSQRSIEQLRAHFALTRVMEVTSSSSSEIQKRFKAYSNSLPAMIQINGLGQALAFANQKAKGSNKDEAEGWSALFNLVSDWLLKERNIWGSSSDKLLLSITQGSQADYQLAQAEAQALLAWVKDFARAEIAGD